MENNQTEDDQQQINYPISKGVPSLQYFLNADSMSSVKETKIKKKNKTLY